MFYVCQVTSCGKCFVTAKSLVSHMSLQHCDDKRLNALCQIDNCMYNFNTVETFRKHIRTKHLAHWVGQHVADDSSYENYATDVEFTESLSSMDNECDTGNDECLVWHTFLNDCT